MTRRLNKEAIPVKSANTTGTKLLEVRKQQHLSPVTVTAVFDSYWNFACERQNVFFRRLEGQPGPWSTDPIIAQHKFTNAYRASDRVSQFLIRDVIYRDDLPSSAEEVLFRTLLFKLFNKIETWKLLEHSLGEVTYKEYSFDRYPRRTTAHVASMQGAKLPWSRTRRCVHP